MLRLLVLSCLFFECFGVPQGGPVVVNTWGFSKATQAAWDVLEKGNNGIETLVAGCSYCEEAQCDGTVGYGGSPDESGETTLDAMIFDGQTMDVGAVADLRRVKNAVSVAKHVLLNTKHSLLAGDQATAFAVAMGFKEESLSTNVSTGIWTEWQKGNCQPNYWKNVEPNPELSCGPYSALSENSVYFEHVKRNVEIDVETSHDTIGMVVIDNENNVVAGTSTNGLRHKIAGRVGDSPIVGAGAYADNEVGGAAATGDGDTMIRFLPSFLAVEEMRRGSTPEEAARSAISRITKHYPIFSGAVIAVNLNGEIGAACNYINEFPYSVMNSSFSEPQILKVPCTNVPTKNF